MEEPPAPSRIPIEHKLWQWLIPDLLTEEALSTHPDELVDYLIKYRLLASKEFTDTLFKRWNTRVVAFARNKDVRVRYSACALLQLTIRHTTYERLLANMNPWFNELSESIRKFQPSSARGAAMLAVAELVHRASRYADLRRDVASAHFTSLLNLFLASFAPDGAKSSAGDGPSNAAAAAPVSDPDDQAVVLRALEQLLQAMPASFKAHLPQLDGLCSSMLRAAGSASLREAAASLLSQLCRSAPSPGEFWAKLLDRTLNSLELLHDEVLAAYLPNADRIVQDKELVRAKRLAGLFGLERGRQRHSSASAQLLFDADVLFGFLRRLLQLPFACTVSIRPERVLALVLRFMELPIRSTLATSAHSLVMHFHRVQTELLHACVDFLALFVERLHHYLVPHLGPLCTSLQTLLTSTRASDLHCQSTRVRLYELSSVLLSTYGLMLRDLLASRLLPQLTKELAPLTHGAMTPDAALLVKSRKRKPQVQAAEVSNAEARAEKLIADAALQMESYLAAMDALAAALFHCGVLLPSSQRLEIDKLLVALLMGQRPDLSELPYSHQPFRLRLLRLVNASLSAPVSGAAPLLPYALAFLSAAIHDPSAECASVARAGLALCEAMQHPRVAPLPPPAALLPPSLTAAAIPTAPSGADVEDALRPPSPPRSKPAATPARPPVDSSSVGAAAHSPALSLDASSMGAASLRSTPLQPPSAFSATAPARSSFGVSGGFLSPSTPSAFLSSPAPASLVAAPLAPGSAPPSLSAPAMAAPPAQKPLFDFAQALASGASKRARTSSPRAHSDPKGDSDEEDEAALADIVDAEPDDPEDD